MGSSYDLTPSHQDADERVLRGILSKRLRQSRKQNKLTMVMLGRRAQCSQSFLSKVESGNLVPSIPMLYRLAGALDVAPSSLLCEAAQSLADQAAGGWIENEQEP